jgi:anti-sigma factor RsiW
MQEKSICQSESIAAYLDGELDDCSRAGFEEHLQECAACAAELRAQQMFVCELDAAMLEAPRLSAPADFARVVAAQAQCDLSGVRSRVEHKRALRFTIIIALFAFALLGSSVGAPVISFVNKLVSLATVFGKAAYDAVASAEIISKALSQKFVGDSGSSGLLVVFLGLAVLLLSRLISSYHRAIE